jgi:hypothetical protein
MLFSASIAGLGLDSRHDRQAAFPVLWRELYQFGSHLGKYMGKAEGEEGCECPGRFWGVVNPKNIPMGERKGIPCTGRQAVQLMRFMLRYVHAVTRRKYRFNHWSMNCMCNADFWLERLPALLGLCSGQIEGVAPAERSFGFDEVAVNT